MVDKKKDPLAEPRGPRAAKHMSVLGILALVCCLLLLTLAGCGITVHPGGDEIALLRGGNLWGIQPDGSNARDLATGGIVSIAWSPDHHQVLYRVLLGGNVAFAPPTSTSAVPDAAAAIAVIGINGGTPLVLSRSDGSVARGDAWWNPGGNRLLYREDFQISPSAAAYIVSQSDQPVGIASKLVLNAASLPVLSSDGHQIAVLDMSGDLLLGAPGSTGAVVARGGVLALPGTGRPAHLLWQPGHNELLYPTASPTGGTRLVLVALGGQVRWSLSVPAFIDAAFSPDGSRLLVRTSSQFEVFQIGGSTALFSWPDSDPYAEPWWAPDGNRLLVLDQSGVKLVNIAKHAVTALGTAASTGAASPTARQWWHPATSDPWSADGSSIVLAAGTGDTWLGKRFPTPSGSSRGLYVVSLPHGEAAGSPLLIDSGDDAAPAWSYADPSTTFLVGA
jgi:hypothetical protein